MDIKSNKVWIYAISFIALLPAAFAQQGVTFTQRLFYVGVNAAVIGIVLWILQTFLMPGKAENEKKAVPIIIFAASILIALLYGSHGYIWQVGPLSVFFNIYLIGNALMIGAVIYLLLGLLKIGNLDSPEGKTGFALLIFLISVFFAYKIGPQWVWSQPMVSKFIGFLFGPQGILNPNPPEYRLWTFVTSFVLIAFFFSNYLFENAGKGQNIVNWLLAAILAMNLATSGVSMSTVVKIGEIIFVMIFAKALKGSVSEKYGMNWWVAILLVGWASYAMAPGMGVMGWIFGTAIPTAGMGILNILKIILEITLIFGLYHLLVKIFGNFGIAAPHGEGGEHPPGNQQGQEPQHRPEDPNAGHGGHGNDHGEGHGHEEQGHENNADELHDAHGQGEPDDRGGAAEDADDQNQALARRNLDDDNTDAERVTADKVPAPAEVLPPEEEPRRQQREPEVIDVKPIATENVGEPKRLTGTIAKTSRQRQSRPKTTKLSNKSSSAKKSKGKEEWNLDLKLSGKISKNGRRKK